MTLLSEQDIEFIRKRGNDLKTVNQQLEYFQQGVKYADIDRAATLGDGIISFDEDQLEELAEDYANMIQGMKVSKFVPASGAASRMFKDLYVCLADDSEKSREKAMKFLERLPDFPFYDDLKNALSKDGHSIEKAAESKDYKLIIRYLLGAEGLNYGNKPKGLLPFHQYDYETRTALEEHLVEAALYACNEGKCNLHFTISNQYKADFDKLLSQVVPKYEKRFGIHYDITFSIQDPSTDTIAAELDNSPFHDENGNPLFRPGGHGALIKNLNDLQSDVVFIKNIDNVATDEHLDVAITYKKAMAAYMLQLQAKVNQYLKMISLNSSSLDMMLLCEIMDFVETELMTPMDGDFSLDALVEKLHRPIRICGMVKNEGEPGGGPFWICNEDGELSLQIIESSQIDKNNPEQMEMLKNATHFNPVDIVCSLRDYEGQHFDLLRCVDNDAIFISTKSYGDRTLKALELPGLWNGAMSDWNTIFVEVPVETFNPVKTVFDLLKK